MKRTEQNRSDEIGAIFRRASRFWDRGNFAKARREFEMGALLGDPDCQLNLGHFLEEGLGGGRDRKQARLWFRRALRGGQTIAASRLGIHSVEDKKYSLGKKWLKKAIKLGDDDSRLDLAKLYITRRKLKNARIQLNALLRSENVIANSVEQARALLGQLKESQR